MAASGSAAALAARVSGTNPNAVLAVVGDAAQAAAISDRATRLRTVPVIALGPGLPALTGPADAAIGALRVVGWSADFTRRNPIARAAVG